jgi:catechol 2,3-dioxygenase
VGHVHLKVTDLAAAYVFYHDQLCLIPNNCVPVIGYGDLGTGDYRVHGVAVNTWTGVGLPPQPPQLAGMDHYTLRLESPKTLNETVGRLDHVETRVGNYLTRDPAGNTIALQAPGQHRQRRRRPVTTHRNPRTTR